MPDATLIAAILLLGAALFAGRTGTGNYLRFAAILCAALALAVLSRVGGLAAAAALVALPLAGAALGLSALARAGRKCPPLLAAFALAAALFAGLATIFIGTVTPVLVPLAFGGVAMMLSGRIIFIASGLLLLAAASAGLSEGLGAGLLAFVAVSLLGAGLYRRVSKMTPSFAQASL